MFIFEPDRHRCHGENLVKVLDQGEGGDLHPSVWQRVDESTKNSGGVLVLKVSERGDFTLGNFLVASDGDEIMV